MGELDQSGGHPTDPQPVGDEAVHTQIVRHLPLICGIVQRITGHDFVRYKQSTLVRRIDRRVHLQHVSSVDEYVAMLQRDAQEVQRLCNDFLISVTAFFRDQEVFKTLAEEVIPGILAGCDGDARVRVWVPGCATGEEAYSIAMLLGEQMASLSVPPSVQIFATDIDEEALDVARQGRYPASIAEQVAAERLDRFFIRQGEEFQISKQIREMCVFSAHNLVRDPPFSSLDLISCRNLLIYLDAELQGRLVPLFQYALRPGGHLLLGPSEGLASYPELFRVVDKKHRLFQRKESVIRPPVDFPLSGPGHPKGRRTELSRISGNLNMRDIGKSVEKLVLEEYAPATVVINERGEILYSMGETSHYLQQPTGVVTNNIISQARKGLRLSLRTAILRVNKTRQPVVHENVAVKTPGGTRAVIVTVRPLSDLGEDSGLLAVVFQATGRVPSTAVPKAPPAQAEETIIQQLETELKTTREELQTAVEELEAANEDLKSSNEELLSTNEELQSANEELQTSKEELQSANEEMETVNEELHSKVEALDEANADLQNLFRSTEIATLFLDRELRIKRFTPAATEIFHLMESDVGRPIGDFAPRFADADVVVEAKQVLETLTIRERQLYLPESQSWYMLRILPSRTLANAIDGVVATFVDITALKLADEAVRSIAQFPDENPSPVMRIDGNGMVLYANPANAMLSAQWCCRTGEPAPEGFAEIARKAIESGEAKEIELTSDDRIFSFILTPIASAGYVNAYGRDITERKQAEEQRLWFARQRQVALDAARLGWWHYNPITRISTYDARYREIFDVTGSERPNDEILKRLHPEDLPGVWEKVEAALDPADPKPYAAEYRIFRSDGSMRWIAAHGVAAFEGEGDARRAVSFVGTVKDVTEQKQADQLLTAAKRDAEKAQAVAEAANRAKDHFLAILSHELRNPLNPVLATASMLCEDPRFDDDVREQLQIISRNAELEALLIDDLLDMTRIERGKVELDRRPIDLCAVLRRAVEVCKPEIDAHRLAFNMDMPAGPCWVNGDSARLQQVFWNLIKNAAKFTPDGGTIRVNCRRDGTDFVVVEVSDNGEGIAPDALPRLFTAFEQGGRPTTRQFGGLGLGLAISKAMVEMHGGTISAQSEGKGKGATFTVRLSLLPSRITAVPPIAVPSAATTAVGSLRILLVEDHADSARIVRRLLMADGHAVQIAPDMASGLRLAQTEEFDLLLSDLGLPDGSGWDLMRTLRARNRDLPGIALSGYGQESDIQQSRDSGFSDHLVKPINPRQLRQAIARVVAAGQV